MQIDILKKYHEIERSWLKMRTPLKIYMLICIPRSTYYWWKNKEKDIKEAKLEQTILTIRVTNHFRYGHWKVAALLKRKYNYHLNRNFQATRPNENTYLPFGTEMLYLSSIMDLYNNEIITYEISNRQDVTLVLKQLRRR